MPPKSKQQKMSLGTFLGDQSLGSWADEMEDTPIAARTGAESRSGYGGERRTFNSSASFGGGGDFGSGGGYPRDQLPLPTRPPYTAHLGNLSFDVTSLDVEKFFGDCSVTNVRIVEDKLDRKPKGFGYVEYASLDGLKKALELNGSQFQGRNIRITIAEPPKDRPETRDISDWSRKGPLAPLPTEMSRRPSDRGFTRNNLDDGPADRRRQAFDPAGDGRVRDFSNWERKGPLTPSGSFSDQQQPREPRPSAGGVGAERSFSRRDSPSWGEGQSASRPLREFAERPPPIDRTPTAAEMDTQWRTKMRPDAPPPAPAAAPASTAPASDVGTGTGTSADASVPSSPVAPIAPASRPRLNLQKRTVSEAPAAGNSDGGASTPAPSGDAKASPFGAARPIDTTQREREIEEKARVKREEAAKLRKEEDEKRADEREKERERAAAAAKTSESKTGAAPVAAKENGASTQRATDAQQQAAAKPTKILQRMPEQEDGTGDAPEVAGAAEDEATAAGQDADANGVIVDDKAVKPQEVTRDIGSGGSGDTAASTADALEQDGWETVGKPGKKGRTGGGRAPAS